MTIEQLREKICEKLSISEYEMLNEVTQPCVMARYLFCYHARAISLNWQTIANMANISRPTYYKSLQRHRELRKSNETYRKVSKEIELWLK